MLQSLSLLAMSNTDLRAAINAEIEKNPALEIPETSDYEEPGMPSPLSLPSGGLEAGDANRDSTFNEDDADASYYEALPSNISLAPGVSDSSDVPDSAAVYGSPVSDSDPASVIESTASETETLQSHLMAQLGLSRTSEKTQKIAEMLIGNLDGNGFLILSVDELFDGCRLPKSEISKAVALVQGFDPPGVCCTDYKESLILQAKLSGMPKADLKIFTSIVNNYLKDLTDGKFGRVARCLHISEEDLRLFYERLKSFNPYPGALFGSEKENIVIPDAKIHIENGEPVLEINRTGIPPLRISEEFRSLISKSDIDLPRGNKSEKQESKEARAYIKSQIRDAETFINMVDMRFKTLARVCKELTIRQSDFFKSGKTHLQNLTIKEVAAELNLSESTVSRLVSSKFIETDWGVFPMRYFFQNGGSGVARSRASLGEQQTAGSRSSARQTEEEPPAKSALSKSAIQSLIIETIDKYGNNGKLSDQKISDALARDHGIQIARRTVNKYRAEIAGV